MEKEILELLKSMQGDIKSIHGEVNSIRKDMTSVELITANNWYDIAKLKAVK